MTEPDSSRRRFELRRLIGAGAFGEVYLAEQVSTGGFKRRVALKLLNESASRMREAARRMRDEARILGRLQHRHIVEVLDLVQLGDRWAIVMAWVPGADLEQVLGWLEAHGRPFPAPAACAIGAAAARALDAAWRAEDDGGRPLRVVHRDIKPSNIRVTRDAEIKVLDFGVARVEELDSREAKTRKPGMLGTERYMAPERILLEGDGPEGDVYALAATVVELLIGRPIGRSPVRDEAHHALVNGVIDEAAGRLAGPDEVKQALLTGLRSALHPLPAPRPTAGDLAELFSQAARHLEGTSLEAFCAEVIPRAAEATDAAPSSELKQRTLIEGSTGGRSEPPPPPPVPRYLGFVVAGLALAGLVLGLAAWRSLPGAPPTAAGVSPAMAPAIEGGLSAGLAPPIEGGANRVASPIEGGANPVAMPDPTLDARSAPIGAGADPSPAAPGAQPTAERPPTAPPAAPAPRTPAVEPPRQTAAKALPPTPEAPAAPTAPEPPPAEPAAPAARVSRILVVVDDVSAFSVRCGDRSAEGTASARVVDLPAGLCTIRASREGQSWSTSVEVSAPRELRCAVQGDKLSCR